MIHLISGLVATCSFCSYPCRHCTEFKRKPLAGYFVISAFFCIPVAAYGVAGLLRSRKGGDCDSLTALSIGHLTLGLLHLAFILHFMRRLERGISEDDEE